MSVVSNLRLDQFSRRTDLIPDRPWLDDANCRGTDPEQFFNSHGVSWATVWDRVKHLCEPCPVRSECRAYGRKQGDGMWGGLAMKEGRPIPYVALSDCGTVGGYKRHLARNENPCGKCCHAKRKDTADRREAEDEQ